MKVSEIKALGREWIRKHKNEVMKMIHKYKVGKGRVTLDKLDWLEERIGEALLKLECENPRIKKVWVMTSPTTSVSLVNAILECNGRRVRVALAKSVA